MVVDLDSRSFKCVIIMVLTKTLCKGSGCMAMPLCLSMTQCSDRNVRSARYGVMLAVEAVFD